MAKNPILTAQVTRDDSGVTLLRSPHKPRRLPLKLLELLRRRGEAWDADIFGSLVKQAALSPSIA